MRKSLSADWLIISRVTEQLTTCNLDQCLQANRKQTDQILQIVSKIQKKNDLNFNLVVVHETVVLVT